MVCFLGCHSKCSEHRTFALGLPPPAVLLIPDQSGMLMLQMVLKEFKSPMEAEFLGRMLVGSTFEESNKAPSFCILQVSPSIASPGDGSFALASDGNSICLQLPGSTRCARHSCATPAERMCMSHLGQMYAYGHNAREEPAVWWATVAHSESCASRRALGMS